MSTSRFSSTNRISKPHHRFILSCCAIALTVLLTSCGGKSGYFKIEGRFMNMNQGEFYIYSLDDTTDGIDTIKVNGGRFSYRMPCEHESTLMLVFPNFSEQPVFAQSGAVAKMKADASHLKELEISGTDDNELMTAFRQQAASASPPEVQKYAETFIHDHPESAVSVYLLRKYFILCEKPDYQKAEAMVSELLKAQEMNGMLNRLRQQLKPLVATTVGKRLPAFTATDTNGNEVSDSYLSEGTAIIYLWASWNHDTREQLRQIKRTARKMGSRLHVLTVSIDAIKKECTRCLEQDTITWHNICDEKMFESPVVKTLGLATLADNIILQDGRIAARSLNATELKEKLNEMSE